MDAIAICCLPSTRNEIGFAPSAPRLKVPEWCTAGSIKCVEVALVRSSKYESTGRREHSGPERRGQPEFPPQGAGSRIEGPYGAIRTVTSGDSLAATIERGPGDILCVPLVVVGTHLSDGHIEEACGGAVRGTKPVGRALQARIDQSAFDRRLLIGDANGSASGIKA